MSRQDMHKQFIERVSAYELGGRTPSVQEIAELLYGGEPEDQAQSGRAIASECKALGLLLVDLDFSAVRTTPAGRILIGK